MIIEQKNEVVTSNTQDEVIPITLETSPEAIQFLIDMLCSLYPNAKQTLLCEYVSNSIDSHTEAGCPERPIEITLPTKFEPFYIVRDYGIGMSHEVVKNMYSKAMGSSKRNTNDQIGGYGVGKLVFAAYSGVMMLTTFSGREKNIYTCRLKGGDGEIRRNVTIDSDEERGVEVKIPVNDEDIEFFNNRAQYLYSFLPTKPIITNNDSIDLNPKASCQNDKFTLLEEFMDGTDQALVTIGGLVFPIEPDQIYKSESWSGPKGDEEIISKVLRNLPIVMHFNVGEIEHTPSRSSLMYSEKTVTAIRERILNDVKELAEVRFKELLESVDSPWNARLTDYQINNKKSFSSKLFSYFKLNKRGIEYNGVEYSSVLPKHDSRKTELSHYKLEDGSTLDNPKWKEVYNIENLQNYHSVRRQYLNHRDQLKTEVIGDLLLNDDVEYYYAEYDYSPRKISIKIKHHIETTGKRDVMTVILQEGESFDEFIERIQAPSHLFKSIDDLENPPKMYKSRTYTSTDRTSHDSKVLKWIGDGEQAAENWEEASLDIKNERAVYVLIKYYKPWDDVDQKYYMHNINSIQEILKDHYDSDLQVYGIRTTEKNKIGSNMILLDDCIKSTMDKLKSKIGVNQHILNNTAWISNYGHRFNNIVNKSTVIDCDAIKHIAHKIKKDQDTYESVKDVYGLIRDYNILCATVDYGRVIDYIPSHEPYEKVRGMAQSISKRYPHIRPDLDYDLRDEHNIEYINALNFYRKNKKNAKKALTA